MFKHSLRKLEEEGQICNNSTTNKETFVIIQGTEKLNVDTPSQTEEEFIVHEKDSGKAVYENDIVILLKEQIKFLKTELNNKQRIIEMLLNKNETPFSKSNNTVNYSPATNNNNNLKTKTKPINQTKQQDKDTIDKRNIAIIGDSMLSGLNAKGLIKNKTDKVKVYTHSGATTDDLIDHINPILRKDPDVIIVHGGTNDITNNVNTIENTEKLIQLVSI